MKILIVHPEDNAEHGPWRGQKWDRVIDLGRGGMATYERWSRQFGCPAEPLDSLELKDFQEVRSWFEAGLGHLLDAANLDWWELSAIFWHQQMEMLVRLRRLAAQITPADHVSITRTGFDADALQLLLARRLFYYKTRRSTRGLARYARAFSRLSWSQLAEIFWDKYDAGYAIRGRFLSKPKPSPGPVVLLPSAYGNVSRLGIAYAKTLPRTDFLLVATRRSGEVANLPANVRLGALAAYVSSSRGRSEEYAQILGRWRSFRTHLESHPDLSILHGLGCFAAFPRLLHQGLAIRDAWRGVLESEPVRAVLCGDDSNPYTHIPLLLAGQRGIPTIAFHHGALDGRHLFKRNHADVILAKGEMEQDYLLRVCGIADDKVEIGAPGELPVLRTREAEQPWIVFFSEPFELSRGRAAEFYGDLLPPLADLALRTSRQLIIKLHAYESLRERRKIIARVLSDAQLKAVSVTTGTLSDALLQNTWFGVTILSSAAVDCAVRGIPCFLAGWLEYWPYGYVQQFDCFGAGRVLNSPAEIGAIPDLLRGCTPESSRRIREPAAPARLEELLSGSGMQQRAVAV